MVSKTDSHWIFRAPNIRARQLFLTGEFNGWLRTATPMAEVEPGTWEVAIHLQPGEYRFRYVTEDDRWFTDYAAFGVVRNDFGEWDSVVYVSQAHKAVQPNRGENTLTAEEVSRLSELMALVWCFTRKGDSVMRRRRRPIRRPQPDTSDRLESCCGGTCDGCPWNRPHEHGKTIVEPDRGQPRDGVTQAEKAALLS